MTPEEKTGASSAYKSAASNLFAHASNLALSVEELKLFSDNGDDVYGDFRGKTKMGGRGRGREEKVKWNRISFAMAAAYLSSKTNDTARPPSGTSSASCSSRRVNMLMRPKPC